MWFVFVFVNRQLTAACLLAPRHQVAVMSSEPALCGWRKKRKKMKTHTQTTSSREAQNQDGGAGDSISTVNGPQSPRIPHLEGKTRENWRISEALLLVC